MERFVSSISSNSISNRFLFCRSRNRFNVSLSCWLTATRTAYNSFASSSVASYFAGLLRMLSARITLFSTARSQRKEIVSSLFCPVSGVVMESRTSFNYLQSCKILWTGKTPYLNEERSVPRSFCRGAGDFFCPDSAASRVKEPWAPLIHRMHVNTNNFERYI